MHIPEGRERTADDARRRVRIMRARQVRFNRLARIMSGQLEGQGTTVDRVIIDPHGKACTNGKVVFVPRDIHDDEAKNALMQEAILAHEVAGHHRYTDFTAWHEKVVNEIKAGRQDRLLHDFVNILEDARVNHLLAQDFGGSGKRLDATQAEFMERHKKNWLSQDADSINPRQGAVIAMMTEAIIRVPHFINHPEVNDFMDEVRPILKNAISQPTTETVIEQSHRLLKAYRAKWPVDPSDESEFGMPDSEDAQGLCDDDMSQDHIERAADEQRRQKREPEAAKKRRFKDLDMPSKNRPNPKPEEDDDEESDCDGEGDGEGDEGDGGGEGAGDDESDSGDPSDGSDSAFDVDTDAGSDAEGESDCDGDSDGDGDGDGEAGNADSIDGDDGGDGDSGGDGFGGDDDGDGDGDSDSDGGSNSKGHNDGRGGEGDSEAMDDSFDDTEPSDLWADLLAEAEADLENDELKATREENDEARDSEEAWDGNDADLNDGNDEWGHEIRVIGGVERFEEECGDMGEWAEHYNGVKRENRKVVNSLCREIERNIRGVDSRWDSQQRRGRLDNRRLWLHRSTKAIFKTRTVEERPEANVLILIDASGSMGSGVGSRAAHASDAAVVMSEVMESLGFNYEIVDFCSSGGLGAGGWTDIRVRKQFNRPLNNSSKAVICAPFSGGNNSDGHAVNWCLKRLDAMGSNRMLFVISDGAPAGPCPEGLNAGQHLINVVRAADPKVGLFSIGIAGMDTSKYYENSVSIPHVNELAQKAAPALRPMLKRIVKKG